jgi:hypothetical protein
MGQGEALCRLLVLMIGCAIVGWELGALVGFGLCMALYAISPS